VKNASALDPLVDPNALEKNTSLLWLDTLRMYGWGGD